MPPAYLTVGSTGVLLSGLMDMFRRLAAAGRDVAIEIASGIIHCWPGYALPESRRTLNRIAAFVMEAI